MMTREMEKLERSLGGIKDLGGIPDVVFIIDIGHEKNAIREAQKLHLPIIGIVDTNHNPEGIDYVVPGNDDSIRAISYYAREVANAVLEAKAAAGTQTSTAAKKVTAKKPVAKKAEADTPAKEVKEVKKSEEKKAPAKAKKETPKAASKPSKTELNALLKADLVALAKKQGIEIASKDTKADIIAKLA
jgi:Ribosomal protein S2